MCRKASPGIFKYSKIKNPAHPGRLGDRVFGFLWT